MNHYTHFNVPEDFTIQHDGITIKGRVLERSVRRLAVQLIEPYGLLHTVRRVHPSVGGALGYEGTAGDTFKVEMLIFLFERARQLADAIPRLASTINSDRQLRDQIIHRLSPVIGSYAPYNAHSFMLATHALEHRPTGLPRIPIFEMPEHILEWPDTKVLLYRALHA
jgi:hypothetical protein